jgi:hypothetical protein
MKKPTVNVFEAADFTFSLIKIARIGKHSKDVQARLSSALIYGNLAEYLAENFLEWIRLKINLNQLAINRQFTISEPGEKEPTNFEQSLRKLRIFNFPFKKEIIDKIDVIRKNRNKLFHGLLKSKENDIDYNNLIKLIQTDTEDLFVLWDDFQKKING